MTKTRMTFVLRGGRRVSGEYHGRALMWDLARETSRLALPG